MGKCGSWWKSVGYAVDVSPSCGIYVQDLHGCVHRLTMTGGWDEHDQYWLCCFANPSSIGL